MTTVNLLLYLTLSAYKNHCTQALTYMYNIPFPHIRRQVDVHVYVEMLAHVAQFPTSSPEIGEKITNTTLNLLLISSTEFRDF